MRHQKNPRRVRMSTSFPPFVHMFSTGRLRLVFFAGVIALYGAIAAAQGVSDVTFFRLFLHDGSTVVSYGEFSRVGDRVVISIPIGGGPESPELQVVSIAADSVDWDKTDAYADAARAARYAVTRGPDDFALLNEAVSRALSDIGLAPDPGRKVAMAAEARQNVMRWTADHYGYQADRVAQMAALFDQVVSDVKAGEGVPNFDLAMVAGRAAPPEAPVLPPPTLRERLEQALRAAAFTPDAADRTSLLRAIVTSLRDVHETWSAGLQTQAGAALQIELVADAAYARLSTSLLRAADVEMRGGRVLGVERLVRRALLGDDRLGHRRPQEMAALLATLDTRLDGARKVRLAQDQWAARLDALRQYDHAVAAVAQLLRESHAALESIEKLAGPPMPALTRLAQRMTTAAAVLASLTVPTEAQSAHALFKDAVLLGRRAADQRRQAVLSGEMRTAWEAASAASGAIMLAERALHDLRVLEQPPIPTLPQRSSSPR